MTDKPMPDGWDKDDYGGINIPIGHATALLELLEMATKLIDDDGTFADPVSEDCQAMAKKLHREIYGE